MAAFASCSFAAGLSRFSLALALGVALVFAGGSAAWAVDCPPCDDGNVCTFDSCDTASGTCRHDPAGRIACDDGNVCTLFDECIGTTCAPGTQQMDCQDGNPCTVDSCNPTTGCAHFLINCNDNNPCTDDVCGGLQCLHLPNNGAPCDDGRACSQDDHCVSGVCSGTGCPCTDLDGDGFAACTAACDPTGIVCGDCADSDPTIHPGAADICDGLDNDCDGIVDDPGGTDFDGDGIGDACDNCPTIANPDQNPCACAQCGVNGLVVERTTQGGGIVHWTTDVEYDVLGFNIVEIDNQGQRTPVTRSLVPCQECASGRGASYAVPIAKHRGGQGLFVEEVHTNGVVQTFGPAVRN